MSEHVKKFQEKHGLVADGIIGKNTFAKLKGILNLNDIQLAHFLGQTAHESGNFKLGAENLNYSEAGLLKTFKKYFTPAQAKTYAKKPVAIGSRVYANRMGNGDEKSGEGYVFRGRAALQLTGKNNYREFSNFIGVDCVKNPDKIITDFYFESALFYFDKNKLWSLCTEINDKAILKLSKAINLGSANNPATPNGLEDRINKTKYYYSFR